MSWPPTSDSFWDTRPRLTPKRRRPGSRLRNPSTETAARTRSAPGTSSGRWVIRHRLATPCQAREAILESDRSDRQRKRRPDRSQETHAAIDAWLDDVCERVEDAERLARASSVPEASAAVDAVGGAEEIADLREHLEADRERLGELAAESERLAARIERVEVPVEMLKRLA